MDIGSGIFSGSLVIGLVVLYIFTRDRWNWGRIVRRSVFGIVAFVGVLSLGIWGKSKYDDRIVPVNEFMSVKLSDSLSDMKFRKGAPAQEGKGIWAYEDSTKIIDTIVLLKDGQVRAVLYVQDCGYCNNLFGLGVGTDYDKVIEKLGQPSHIDTSNDSLERVVSFEKEHLVFRLEKGKIVAFGIYNPQYGPVAFTSAADK